MDFTFLTSCQVSASLHFGPCYQRQLPFLTNPFVFPEVPFCSLAAGQSDSVKHFVLSPEGVWFQSRRASNALEVAISDT